MPITKFKTFEEAEKALYCFQPDTDYYDRLNEFFQLASFLHPTKCQRGIVKYKTFEDFTRAKEISES